MAGSAFTIQLPNMVTTDMRSNDMLPAVPRLRMSLDRTAPLTLSDTWQSIPWVSTNTPYDVNTFTNSRFDTGTKAVLPNTSVSYDQNYSLELDFKFQHTKRPLNFQLRFVVPRPAELGGPIVFPLPQSDQYVDLLWLGKTFTGGLLGNLLSVLNLSLAEDTSTMTNRVTYSRNIYSSLNAKTYGVQVQLRIAQAYTSGDRPQLVDSVLLLQPAG